MLIIHVVSFIFFICANKRLYLSSPVHRTFTPCHHNSCPWQRRILGTPSQSEDCGNLCGHGTEELSGKLRVWLYGWNGVWVSAQGDGVAKMMPQRKVNPIFEHPNLKQGKGELFFWMRDVCFVCFLRKLWRMALLKDGMVASCVSSFSIWFLFCWPRSLGVFLVCEVGNSIGWHWIHSQKTIDWNRKMEDEFQVPCEFSAGMFKYQTRSDLHLWSMLRG